MFRRRFFRNASLAAMAAFAGLPPAKARVYFSGRLLKPKRLREGATIGLIAPASPVSDEKIGKALANLNEQGFRVKEGLSLRARHGYLAGTDEARLADIHWAFADPEVDAVWCVRGGYGTTRLLPYIDYKLIRHHPKPFIGYSDITAMHIAIGQRSGLVTFHGPVGASDFPEDTLRYFRAALMEAPLRYEIAAPPPSDALPGPEFQPYTLAPGLARGALIGGNLSLLSALAGTSFSPVFRHKIVFIEDVGEQPYRVDRMFTQLLQATDLSQAAGIVLGDFTDCAPKNTEFSFFLPETLHDCLGKLGIPVAYGLPFGHVPHLATFPCGIEAEFDAEKKTLVLLESGVE